MDIFDQIDRRTKTREYQKSAEVTARLMLYNSKHSDELLTVKKISNQTGFSEEIIKNILAGIHDNLNDYQKVQDFIENYKENPSESRYAAKVNTDNLNYSVNENDAIKFETILGKIDRINNNHLKIDQVNNDYFRKKINRINRDNLELHSYLKSSRSNSRDIQPMDDSSKKFNKLKLGVIYG